MGLLSKSSVAHLTHERFLSGVDLEMLLEVESLGVDQETTTWTTLVIRPEKKKIIFEEKIFLCQPTSDHSCGC